MSKAEKQKSIIDEFMRSSEYNSLFNMARVLNNRDEFGHKHFNQVFDAIQRMKQELPILGINEVLDNRKEHKNKRSLLAFISYLVPDEGNFKQSDINKYLRPHILNLMMSKDTYSTFSRAIPLEISHSHIEKRYNERIDFSMDGNNFNYNDHYMAYMYAFSLVMAKVLEEKLIATNKGSSYVAIPHPEGLYVGRAYLQSESDTFKINNFDVNKRFKNKSNLKNPEKALWNPRVNIKIRSIISDTMMNSRGYEYELFKKPSKSYLNKNIQQTLCRGMCDYVTGNKLLSSSLDQTDINNLSKIHAKLKLDIESEEWQETALIAEAFERKNHRSTQYRY